jgi:hypothetical protein
MEELAELVAPLSESARRKILWENVSRTYELGWVSRTGRKRRGSPPPPSTRASGPISAVNSNEIARRARGYWTTTLLFEPPLAAVDDVDIPSVCCTVSTSLQICTPDPVGIDSVSGSAFCGRVRTISLDASAVFVQARQLGAAPLVAELCESLAAGFAQLQLEGSVKLTSRNLITRSGAGSVCCGVATGVGGDVDPFIWATAPTAGTNSTPNTNHDDLLMRTSVTTSNSSGDRSPADVRRVLVRGRANSSELAAQPGKSTPAQKSSGRKEAALDLAPRLSERVLDERRAKRHRPHPAHGE